MMFTLNLNADFRLWNVDLLVFKFSPKLSGIIYLDFQMYNNADRLSYAHFDVGVSYQALKRLNFQLDVRHYRDPVNNWENSWNRLEFSISPTFTLGSVFCKIRNRFELLIPTPANTDSSFRYNNQITFVFPAIISSIKLKPVLINEVLFTLDPSDFVVDIV